MDNFANIGKAAIIQSLGIQKNYTEEIETTVDAIDYSNTACSTCKYKAIINTFDKNSKPYADACASCASCPHKTLIQKKVSCSENPQRTELNAVTASFRRR